MAVLITWNLDKRPFLGQVVYLGLLLFTELDLRTCWFVPTPYFYSETNSWLKDSEAMSAAAVCNMFLQHPLKLNFPDCSSLLQEWLHFFLKRACHSPLRQQQTWKCPVFVLAIWPAWAVLERCPNGPQELGHWFCSKNLRFSSGTAWGSDCQMTSRGSNWTQTWTLPGSTAWPASYKGFLCSDSEIPKLLTVWESNSFRSLDQQNLSVWNSLVFFPLGQY